jgi:hypothetical protein
VDARRSQAPQDEGAGVADRSRFDEQLAAVLSDGGPLSAQRICELCIDTLPVTGAAITAMTSNEHQSTVWASDDVAVRIDELQFRLGEGPCVEAFTSRAPVLITDIAAEPDLRWPVFAAAAARDTPARGMYVFPLLGGPISIGVLDFYRDLPGDLEPEDIARARRASQAAFWSVLASRPAHTLDPSGEPRSDDDSDDWPSDMALERREVYQATGMIIAQLDVSADAALATLRAHAFVHDRPIDAVARDVVARTLRFGEVQ